MKKVTKTKVFGRYTREHYDEATKDIVNKIVTAEEDIDIFLTVEDWSQFLVGVTFFLVIYPNGYNILLDFNSPKKSTVYLSKDITGQRYCLRVCNAFGKLVTVYNVSLVLALEPFDFPEEAVEKAINKYFIGATSLSAYVKEEVREKLPNVRKMFPQLPLKLSQKLRKGYTGGLCFLNEQHRDKLLENVVELDVNQMYAFILSSMSLPCGLPEIRSYANGEVTALDELDAQLSDCRDKLFIVEAYVCYRFAKGVPFYAPKDRYADILKENRYSSAGDIVTVTMTLQELRLFASCYDFDYFEVKRVYIFESCVGYFNDFLQFEPKSQSINRKIKKNINNLLCGLFAENELCTTSKLQTLVKRNTLTYIPLPFFVNSYARCKLISYIRRYPEADYIYSDTDSAYIIDRDERSYADVGEMPGQYKLKRWKHARFFGEKKYTVGNATESKNRYAGLHIRHSDFDTDLILHTDNPDYAYKRVKFNPERMKYDTVIHTYKLHKT